MSRRVLFATKDLFFKAKLRAVATACGADVSSESGAGDVAVVELGQPSALDRIRELSGRGVRVLAFGPHGEAALLRQAREAGAEAVPNSQVESRLFALLQEATA